MEQITQYVYDLFIGYGVVNPVGCFVVSQIVNALECVPNKFVPLVCGVLGAVIAAAIPSIFPDTAITIQAINGLALGRAAKGGFETLRELKNKKASEQ